MIVKCKIVEVSKHDNADSLFVTKCDIGKSDPIQVVTNIDNLEVGSKIPVALVGHVMPEGHPVPKIKEAKLRGVPSYGMFVLTDEIEVSDFEDRDIGSVLVEDPKIEPLEGIPQIAVKKVTNIDNGYQVDIPFFINKEVVIMEKMEGSSHRIGFTNGTQWCGGKNYLHRIHPTEKAEHDGFGFGKWVHDSGWADAIEEYAVENGISDIGIYGEFCGPKIQKNPYALKNQDFFVFDIAIDGVWQDWKKVVEIALIDLGMRLVPVDMEGTFDLDFLNDIITQPSQMGEEYVREGVVLKLAKEGRFPRGGRAILKHKPEEKQERKSNRGKLELTPEQIEYNNLKDKVTEYITEERIVHAIGHIKEAGGTVDFKTVMKEVHDDILKEADEEHRKEFEEKPNDFKKAVGKAVGGSNDVKKLILKEME